MGEFFGTDGFRGRAGVRLAAAHAFAVGRYLGSTGEGGRAARVVIGKDTRRSSYMLEYALASGVAASGGEAHLLHVVTTPCVCHCVRAFGYDAGVMISASHNAYPDNGIKIFSRGGQKADDGLISSVEACLGGDPPPYAADGAVGRIVDMPAGRKSYLASLLSLSEVPFTGYRVGLDCANGGAYNLARRAFADLGAEVCAIGCRPDGLNINDGCGSTHPLRLCAMVARRGLDVGFAFDGDGDRCICADERGNVVDGDGILYILARYLKGRGGLEGDGIVATVMSNGGLESSLARQGVRLFRCPVGDRNVAEALIARGLSLGGEQSGHIIVGRGGCGDGIATAIWLMQALVRSGGPLSALTAGLALLPQKLVNVEADGDCLSDGGVRAACGEARALLGARGRLIVRPSGTESVVRIMAESEDEGACAAACAAIEKSIKEGGYVRDNRIRGQ